MALQEEKTYKYEDKYTIRLGKYRFRMRPEEKKALKKRMESDPEFAKALLEEVVNDDLFAALEYSVRFKSNAIMQIYGIPESGKSTIAKILVYHLVQMLKNQGQTPDVRLTYNYADTIHEVSRFGKEHLDENDNYVPSDKVLVIFQDEQSQLQGAESRSYEVQLNTLLERFRAAQIFVILVAPNPRVFSVCNTYIESLGKDLEHRKNWAVLHVEKKNGRIGGETVHLSPVGTLLLDYTPEIEAFFSDYEQKKMSDIAKLMKRRGLQTIQIPEDILEEGIQTLLREAKKRGLRTKEQLKSLANVLGLGTTNTTKTIAELAGLQFEAELQKMKEEREREELLKKQREEEQRKKEITRKVNEIARELYEAFDFVDSDINKKSFSRLVKGWLIENYPESWQELIKYSNQMWALAEYWQLTNNEKSVENTPNSRDDSITRISDRELLRTALIEALEHNKHRGINKAHRTYWAWYWVPPESISRDNWNEEAVYHFLRAKGIIQPPEKGGATFRSFKKMLQVTGRIDFEEKRVISGPFKKRAVWGNLCEWWGELYFARKLQRELENLWPDKTQVPTVSSPGLEAGGAPGKCDTVVVLSSGSSGESSGEEALAVNVKVSPLRKNGSHELVPEHEHPSKNVFLFVLDPFSLQEAVFKAEPGKPFLYVNQGVLSEAMSVRELAEWVVKKFYKK